MSTSSARDAIYLWVSQNLDLLEPHNLVPAGVFTIDGMLKYGEQHKQCPYFSVRRMVGCMQRLEVWTVAKRSRCHFATL